MEDFKIEHPGSDTETMAIVDGGYKKYIPWVTVFCCLISIGLFIGINTESKELTWNIYKKWGAPSASDIWNGAYWGLITSAFLHVAIWHIVFNLSWFWMFSKKIEFESGKLFYTAFALSSAFISSVSQLAFSGSTGIGLSGVVYALFGFLFIKGKFSAAYADFITKQTARLFMVWLVVCVALSYTNIWQVGNAAHIAGLLWGLLIGQLSKYKKVFQAGIPALFLTVSSISLFWMPWSVSWLSVKAYNLHKDQKVDEAEKMYKLILEKEAGNQFAAENLQLIQVDKLSKLALQYYKNRNYHDARTVFGEILKIDPANKWAIENMKNLPPDQQVDTTARK